MFPSGNVPHCPLLEATCERTTPESSPAPPSTEKGNDLSTWWLRDGAGLRYFWVSLSLSLGSTKVAYSLLIYMVKFQRRFCPHKGERSTLFGGRGAGGGGAGVCMFKFGEDIRKSIWPESKSYVLQSAISEVLVGVSLVAQW